MATQKTRSKKTEVAVTGSGGELEALAMQMTNLASSVKNSQERSGEAEKLVTRRNALQQYQVTLARLKDSLSALALVRGMESARSEAVRGLKGQRNAARAIATSCAEDPRFVTKARSLEGLRPVDLEVVEATLLVAWQAYLGTGERSGLESVLSRFPQLKAEARAVADARRNLQTRASRLPRSVSEAKECEECRTRLGDILAEVDGSGIDAEILAFLKTSVDGIPLSRVLESERVLAWLKQHDLARQFLVRSL